MNDSFHTYQSEVAQLLFSDRDGQKSVAPK